VQRHPRDLREPTDLDADVRPPARGDESLTANFINSI
jgi:hypothetical protein